MLRAPARHAGNRPTPVCAAPAALKGSIQKHRRHAIPLRQRGCLWPRTLLQHRPVHRECVPCRPSTWSPARRATLVRNSTQHVWASPPCSHRLHHPPQAQPELPASMSHQWSTRQVVSAVDDSSHTATATCDWVPQSSQIYKPSSLWLNAPHGVSSRLTRLY
jgi:hypothetical protein